MKWCVQIYIYIYIYTLFTTYVDIGIHNYAYEVEQILPILALATGDRMTPPFMLPLLLRLTALEFRCPGISE